MKLRKLALAPIAAAVMALGAPAHAATFTDVTNGVVYSLTDIGHVGGTADTHDFRLDLDTDNYSQNPTAWLAGVDIGVTSNIIAAHSSLLSTTAVGTWAFDPEGALTANGCSSNSSANFACAGTSNQSNTVKPGNGIGVVDYSFVFRVGSGNGFFDVANGSHIGAQYDRFGPNGMVLNNSLTSMTTAIPEPETYAMLLAGLGLMAFVARRRRESLGNLVPA